MFHVVTLYVKSFLCGLNRNGIDWYFCFSSYIEKIDSPSSSGYLNQSLMNISHMINQRFMIRWPAMYWFGSNYVIQKSDQTAMYLVVAVVSSVVAWKNVIQKTGFVFLIRLIRDIVDREFLTLLSYEDPPPPPIMLTPPTFLIYFLFFLYKGGRGVQRRE